MADLSAGLYLAIGVLVTLHDRRRTGEGRWVRTSLLEAMVAMDLQAVRYTVEGTVPVQEGNHHPTQVPMGCFRSADGFINVAGPSGRLLHRFCEVIGLPDLPKTRGSTRPPSGPPVRDDLNAVIGDRLRPGPPPSGSNCSTGLGCRAVPCCRMDQVFADPQVEYLQLTTTVESPELGAMTILRNPVTMSRVTRRCVRPVRRRASTLTRCSRNSG